MARGTAPEKYAAQIVGICSTIADEILKTDTNLLIADQEQGNDDDTNTIRGRLSAVLYDLKENNKE